MSDTPPISMLCGYPVEIVAGTIEKKYLCSHCHLVLREPMQSFCGHRFCKNCAQALLQNVEVPCPACEEEGTATEFSVIKEGQIFPDNAMKREFQSWKVTCANPGCSWSGSFKEYEAHSRQCERRTTRCEECGRAVPVANMERHRSSECPNRAVQCPHCHIQVPALELKEHIAMACLKVPVKCDACGKEMLREKLESHYNPDNGECSAKRICCPYKCGQFVDPDILEQHEQQSIVEHVRAINRRVHLMEGRPPTSSVGASMQATQLSTPVQVSSEIQELRQKVVALERKVDTALGDTSVQAIASSSGSAASSSSSSGDLSKRVAVLEEKMNAFLDATGALENGIERNTSKLENLQRNIDTQNKSLEARCKTVEKGLAVKDLSTAELEQRIKTLEVSSYDGVLLWKITDFSRKRQDAISGRTTSIYSPPFYTSRTGYKMCARMYLNGDGMGKGNYISMFFVIMRNEYDALLGWPFRQKVSMILIDQNNLTHIVDAFRPDPSSSSFRRPSSEMNIASGCPLFCPLSSLTSTQHAYVKDDTMYVKIIVDVTDLHA